MREIHLLMNHRDQNYNREKITWSAMNISFFAHWNFLSIYVNSKLNDNGCLTDLSLLEIKRHYVCDFLSDVISEVNKSRDYCSPSLISSDEMQVRFFPKTRAWNNTWHPYLFRGYGFLNFYNYVPQYCVHTKSYLQFSQLKYIVTCTIFFWYYHFIRTKICRFLTRCAPYLLLCFLGGKAQDKGASSSEYSRLRRN